MVFVEWYPIAVYCLLFAMVSIAALIFWSVRKRKWTFRLPLRLISAILVITAAFILTIGGAFPNPNSYSVPVYAPDRRAAARVWNYDPGPLGKAESYVEVFTAHGFRSHVVFSGEWQSIKAENIRWIGDTQLELSSAEPAWSCVGTTNISVQCRDASTN